MRRRRLRVRFAAVALLAVIPLVISGALRYRASQADQRDIAQQQSAVAALYLVAASAVEPARGDISAFDQPIQALGADVNAFWETRRADLTDPARAAGTVVELAELIGAGAQLGSGSDAAQLHLGDLVSRHHPRLVTSIARVEAAPTDSDAVRATVAALRSLAAAPGSAQAAEPDVWANELLDRATRLEQRLTNPAPITTVADLRSAGLPSAATAAEWWRVDRAALESRLEQRSVDLSKTITRQLLMTVLVVLLVVGLVWAAHTSIVKPLASVAHVLQQFGTGRFDVRADVDGADELADVGLSINTTIERVRTTGEQLERRASHDPLTGLPNRSRALSVIQESLEQMQPGRCLAICFVDLDRFKLVNDTYGHAAGDVVLQTTARRLLSVAPDGATVARLAGDEFALIWPNVSEVELARQVARRALATLKQPVELPDGSVTRHLGDGASIGLALNSGQLRVTAEELLSSADIAMYEAKLHGRGQVCEFTDELRHAVSTRLRLRADLRSAIDEPERWGLTVKFQPIIEVATKRLLGAESLSRWTHPELGEISPSIFVPIAEDSGMVAPLGRLVMQQATTALARWNQRASGLHVACNISALHLGEGTLRSDVERVLDRSGIDVSGLWLELTESSVMSDPQGSRALLAEMRQLGVGLSIDDFGTGYSSLSYLHEIQATALKIDQSFVHRLLGPDRDRAEQIIRVMIDLAHSLGLIVIAEGIEQPAQFAVLERLGCDAAQGYLIGKPMTSADLERRLEVRAAVVA